MSQSLIDRDFYDAIVQFNRSEAARDHFYRVMDTPIDRYGRPDTVRNQVLRTYAMLFCDDMNLAPGQPAGPEEVEATADRLNTGGMGFDPKHWYRMRHHFPKIDEDNYDRFAALVIADLRSGPLHDAAVNGGDMLMVGEADPLHMTPEQRSHQKLRPIRIGGNGQ